MTTKIAFFGISDPGQQRANNEDHFLVADLTRQLFGVKNNRVLPQLIYHEVGPRGTLLAVADGLGGYEGGEVASLLAVETTAQTLFAATSAAAATPMQLRTAVEAAHQAICARHHEVPGKETMSSTLTAVHVDQRILTIAQVGDSRAYLFSHGRLTLLTEDQTVVRMLQKKGMLTDEEALHHPDRHVILQALGQSQQVTPEVQRLPFQDGDCLLLCTDGLFSCVPHACIEAILNTEKHENVRCQRLIEAAYRASSPDNVTVLLARLLQ
jgi:serine/threonine protein phosphatase PrpC